MFSIANLVRGLIFGQAGGAIVNNPTPEFGRGIDSNTYTLTDNDSASADARLTTPSRPQNNDQMNSVSAIHSMQANLLRPVTRNRREVPGEYTELVTNYDLNERIYKYSDGWYLEQRDQSVYKLEGLDDVGELDVIEEIDDEFGHYEIKTDIKLGGIANNGSTLYLLRFDKTDCDQTLIEINAPTGKTIQEFTANFPVIAVKLDSGEVYINQINGNSFVNKASFELNTDISFNLRDGFFDILSNEHGSRDSGQYEKSFELISYKKSQTGKLSITARTLSLQSPDEYDHGDIYSGTFDAPKISSVGIDANAKVNELEIKGDKLIDWEHRIIHRGDRDSGYKSTSMIIARVEDAGDEKVYLVQSSREINRQDVLSVDKGDELYVDLNDNLEPVYVIGKSNDYTLHVNGKTASVSSKQIVKVNAAYSGDLIHVISSTQAGRYDVDTFNSNAQLLLQHNDDYVLSETARSLLKPRLSKSDMSYIEECPELAGNPYIYKIGTENYTNHTLGDIFYDCNPCRVQYASIPSCDLMEFNQNLAKQQFGNYVVDPSVVLSFDDISEKSISDLKLFMDKLQVREITRENEDTGEMIQKIMLVSYLNGQVKGWEIEANDSESNDITYGVHDLYYNPSASFESVASENHWALTETHGYVLNDDNTITAHSIFRNGEGADSETIKLKEIKGSYTAIFELNDEVLCEASYDNGRRDLVSLNGDIIWQNCPSKVSVKHGLGYGVLDGAFQFKQLGNTDNKIATLSLKGNEEHLSKVTILEPINGFDYNVVLIELGLQNTKGIGGNLQYKVPVLLTVNKDGLKNEIRLDHLEYDDQPGLWISNPHTTESQLSNSEQTVLSLTHTQESWNYCGYMCYANSFDRSYFSLTNEGLKLLVKSPRVDFYRTPDHRYSEIIPHNCNDSIEIGDDYHAALAAQLNTSKENVKQCLGATLEFADNQLNTIGLTGVAQQEAFLKYYEELSYKHQLICWSFISNISELYRTFYNMENPSISPTVSPSFRPTGVPSRSPSNSPSSSPSKNPSFSPTVGPSLSPSTNPSNSPSNSPSSSPSKNPSFSPTVGPSRSPSSSPSKNPSFRPTGVPSRSPSTNPSVSPSTHPSNSPSRSPSTNPSVSPSTHPSVSPSTHPSNSPSISPSTNPSVSPSTNPSSSPSTSPSSSPSTNPSNLPSSSPTKLSVNKSSNQDRSSDAVVIAGSVIGTLAGIYLIAAAVNKFRQNRDPQNLNGLSLSFDNPTYYAAERTDELNSGDSTQVIYSETLNIEELYAEPKAEVDSQLSFVSSELYNGEVKIEESTI